MSSAIRTVCLKKPRARFVEETPRRAKAFRYNRRRPRNAIAGAISSHAASRRGESLELFPAPERDPRRLRTRLLGRQLHGNLRAHRLLRHHRSPRDLPQRTAPLLERTHRLARRHLRPRRLVPAYSRRHSCRPLRLPPRPHGRLPNYGRRIFPARFACRPVDAALATRAHRQMARVHHPDDSRAGSGRREAMRRRNHRARVQRKRPLDRLFDLLHARQYRRRDRPVHGFCCAQTDGLGRRKCLSSGIAQRVPDVLGHALLLSRATALRRRKGFKHTHGNQEYVRRPRQSALRNVPGYLFRLLRDFLAAIYFHAALHPQIRQP